MNKSKVAKKARKTIDVDSRNFDKQVIKWKGIVVVDFWAPWCNPCKKISPLLESIAKENLGSYKIVKVNTDKEKRLPAKYKIVSLPTLILFKDGRKISQLSGIHSKYKINSWISSAVQKK